MQNQRIKRIAIIGGGTAGWIAASALARKLGRSCSITLVESPDIPTVGVGEATIPPIIDFLNFLGIEQRDFIANVQATIKLAIRFDDWHHLGHRYWHPFGPLGVFIDRQPFYHFWHKARAEQLAVDLSHFNLEIAMCEANKFMFPDQAGGNANGPRYALHFDAGLAAQYLRVYSERLGVTRLERSVCGATHLPDGRIDEVIFKEGDRIKADLYIDCTGFRGLLIEGALQTGYVDWSSFLPNDRAVAAQVPNQLPRPPYTRAIARPAGWQWRIPLQHRVGTGYVYSSAHCSDQAALDDLLSQPGNSEPLTEPRVIKFTTGHRRAFWNRNCIALGLASGFIEPLESTSIHLAISGVYCLLDHFPDLNFDPVNTAHYNAQLTEEYERVRDFIALHYFPTTRNDTEYWQHCQRLKVPDTLMERTEMFKRTGRIFYKRHEVFTELSWFFVMHGMGMSPQRYDPLVDASDWDRVKQAMAQIKHNVAAATAAAPMHDSFFSATPQATAPARGWQARPHHSI